MTSRAWNILLKIANSDTDKAKKEMSDATNQRKAIQAKLRHLGTIRDEYQERLQSMQGDGHSIDKNLLYRRFIGQVSSLEERLFRDLKAATAWTVNAHKKLIEARKEQAKFKFLIDRRKKMQKENAQREEQKQMDSLGIIRYNYNLK